jgi:cell division protein FtsA
MARTEHFVGLDIGSQTIRVVVAMRPENNNGVIILDAAEVPADGMRKGAVVSPDATAKSIQKAIFEIRKSSGLVIDHATVSIGDPRISTYVSTGTVSVSRADGEVTREDVSRAHEASEAALPRLGNREIIHSLPLFYSIDKETDIREPVGLTGMKLEVEMLFVASFTQHLKNIFKAIELVGLAADDVLAAPYAASFHALGKKQKEVGTLLLDIGAHISTLAVFEEGLLVSLEVIPFGSGHITYDIGIGFQIDSVSAERVKRNLASFLELGKKEIRLSDFPKNFENTFSQKKLKEIVDARLGDIFEFVTKHLRKIERAELLPGGVVFVGGGSKLFEIVSHARDELSLPVEIFSGSHGLAGKKELVSGPEWATAVGLARYALQENSSHARMGGIFSSPLSRRIGKIFRAFIP